MSPTDSGDSPVQDTFLDDLAWVAKELVVPTEESPLGMQKKDE